jgi:ABC-type transporter Mla maintaining outer membrane lipid asymmetry permease subunit MlaE
MVATLLCCRQGFRCVGDHSHWPNLVSDAILQSLMVILLLELFWVGLLNRVVLA